MVCKTSFVLERFWPTYVQKYYLRVAEPSAATLATQPSKLFWSEKFLCNYVELYYVRASEEVYNSSCWEIRCIFCV